jgi:hypothetical protein
MYAAELSILGTVPTTGGAAFISPDLGTSNTTIKSGFTIDMAGTAAPATTPMNCQGFAGATNMVSGFYATATAQSASTGSRNFWTNTSGTVYTQAQTVGAFVSTNEVGAPSTGAPIQ